MIRLLSNLLVFLSFIVIASADFVGFPLATNDNAYTWYQTRTSYNPIGQIYSGIVERCNLTGISAPNIVETWTCSAGRSNDIVVIDGYTYTNIVLLTKDITTTNQIGLFSYSYSDQSGTHSATGYPFLSNYFMNELDDCIDLLIPEFLCSDTNIYVNTSYNNWFRDMATNTWSLTDVYSSFPTESKVGLFHRANIGYTSNLTSNEINYITGGNAWYTRQPATTVNTLLSEIHAGTNGWTYIDIGLFDKRYYDDCKPLVRYMSGGTNVQSEVDLYITGTMLVISNQSLITTNETISIGTNDVLSNITWYDVNNMTTTDSISNTGTVYSLLYTNEITLFGDRPFRLSATDLDERATVLSALTVTELQYNFDSGGSNGVKWVNGVTDDGEKYGNGFGKSTAALARSTSEADYAFRYGSSMPKKIAWIYYDSDTDDYDAAINAAKDSVVVSNSYNSISRNIQVYFKTLVPSYDRSRSTNNYSFVWDNYGSVLMENQVSLYYSLTTTAAVITTSVLGDYDAPTWCDDPAGVDVHLGNSRGYQVQNVSVCAEWNFSFK